MKKIIAITMACLAAITATAQEQDHNFKIAKNLNAFNAIYRNLDMMYVDTLDADDVVGFGIRAMLNSLDPYTEYYPEESLKDLKMMITGKYAGIGSMIRENMRHNCCMIDQPYRGMPADELGLKRGDLILAIDDTTMVGKPVNYVSEHLRGDPGSSFKLKIRRLSTGKEMTFNVTRRAIQLPAVPYYGMIRDNVGYINLNSYTEGCAKDVRRAFVAMKQQGMNKLIFDVRDNGGGSVQEALEIVSMFVPRNTTVLTMRGKTPRANKEYKTGVEPIDTVMPIVVLVSDGTASASEITAGALQDLDRAVVMGTRTYGKGLVQTTMELPYNGQMKLTTSKYYIPSGRCIQAINYKHKNGGYTEHVPDSLTKVFHTAAGRPVRDGGGIKPDIEVKEDTLTNIAYYLMNSRDSSEVLFEYEYEYIQNHPTIAPPSEFMISDSDYDLLKQRVVESNFKYDKQTEKFLEQLKSLAKFEGYYDDTKEEFEALEKKLIHNTERDMEINRRLIKDLVSRDICRCYYYDGGAIEHSLRADKQVARALEMLTDIQSYNDVLTPKADKKQ